MPFHPFAVQCQTCGSRLRVTDPTLVGTIAACPKCQSMVQIDTPVGTPPEESAAMVPPSGGQLMVGASSVDSGAITEDAIAPDGEIRIGEPPVERGFAGADALPPDSQHPEPPLPDRPDGLEWQSDRTRRTRQIALVTTLSISTLLIAVLAFGWFIRTYRGKAATPTTVATDDTKIEAEVAAVPPTDLEVDESADLPLADAHAETTDGKQANAPELAEAPKPTDATEPHQASPSVEQPLIPVDLMPDSPFAVDPKMPPKNRDGAAPEPTDDPDASKLMELPPGLAQYTPFLLQEGPAETPTLKAPPTMDEVNIEAAAEDDLDPLEKIEPRTLNLKSDLAIKMAFRSEGYPMSELILLMSQVTGVPIQIDWVSFDLVGTPVEVRVQPPKSAATARQMLDQVAAQVGAEIREQESLLLWTAAEAPFAATLLQLTNLDDFGDGAQSAGDVLEDFLRNDLPPPEKMVGVDDLNDPLFEDPNEELVEIPAEVVDLRARQQLSVLATETLRRMRGMETKLSSETLGRWTQTSASQDTDWPKLLDGEAGAQLDTPISMAGILLRTSRLNSATCLVNWFDANRRGIGPERLMLPDASKGAGGMLAKAFAPLGLHVRRVDREHWWVGSDSTYDRLPVIVASEPLGAGRAVFVERINQIMAGSDRDSFRIAIDEASDRALMMLPRFLVRQLPKVSERVALD